MTANDEQIAQETLKLLTEDRQREEAINAPFNPITGEGSTGARKKVVISDFPGMGTMWLPVAMCQSTLVKRLVRSKTIDKFIKTYLKRDSTPDVREAVIERFIRLRIKHDFTFWAAYLVLIKPKKAGPLIHFKLNRPQRILVNKLESMRLNGDPIRIVVLKARQWGGSTCIQMYMAWMQLVLMKGASSAIEAHQNTASSNIQKMFRTMLDNYPVRYMHETDEEWDEREKRYVNDPIVRSVIKVPARGFEIQVGSAMNPESSRSTAVTLAHCSEVAFWPDTGERTPQKLVNAVTSGILAEANTFIAYESTALGETNWFHDAYVDAKDAELRGDKDFLNKSIFIAWYQIEQYSKPFDTEEEKIAFADSLIDHRNETTAKDNRHEPGAYLWRLWTMGATLEAIHWYVVKRTEYTDHADMANEYPSDDIEAFRHSGTTVFDIYDIEKMRPDLKTPKWKGEIQGKSHRGQESLEDLRFVQDENGQLQIWEKPEIFDDIKVTERYLVTVDIGGRWKNADWSIISVIDRYWMMEGGKPKIVAQWAGHIDHDLLAWKAAQIAKWYDEALLVIESNTLETKDKNRMVDGDQSLFILDEIKLSYENLYARKQSPEDIAQHAPRKYGFHTNTNTKPAIISHLIQIVRDQAYKERDESCWDEYKTYQLNEGVYEAAPKHHDDRLMTRAIGLWVCYKEMDIPKIVNLQSRKKPKSSARQTEATII